MSDMKIGILASGWGVSACALIEAISLGELDAEVSLILSNQQNAPIIEVAQELDMPCLVLRPDLFASREEYDARIALEFWNRQSSVILLSDYTRIISMPLLNSFSGRILSIHNSLLPAFSGKEMYGRAVLKNTLKRGVTIAGCTAYVVNENIAEGEILEQSTIEVSPNDQLESLQKKLDSCQENLAPKVIKKYIRRVGMMDFSQRPYALKDADTTVSASSSKASPAMQTGSANLSQSEYYNDEQKQYFAEGSQGEKVYALCDVGIKRKENMDTVLLTADGRLMGAADGVGSAKGGKQTSRMIMNALSAKWQNEGKKLGLEGSQHGEWLRKTVIAANQHILKWAATQKEDADLGSTLVLGLLDPEHHDLYISNTGDSRAYLWREGILYRLTRDHSEDYDPETGDGGALLFYIGGGKGAFAVDIFRLALQADDKVLFCSDGLLYASESKIVERFASVHDIQELAHVLLEDTYEAGAPDNTSITILDYAVSA